MANKLTAPISFTRKTVYTLRCIDALQIKHFVGLVIFTWQFGSFASSPNRIDGWYAYLMQNVHIYFYCLGFSANNSSFGIASGALLTSRQLNDCLCERDVKSFQWIIHANKMTIYYLNALVAVLINWLHKAIFENINAFHCVGKQTTRGEVLVIHMDQLCSAIPRRRKNKQWKNGDDNVQTDQLAQINDD